MSMDPAFPAPTQGAADGERRACFNCDFINAAGAAACEHCGADLRDVPLRRDLKMEEHLTAIAIWFPTLGFFVAAVGVGLVVTGIVDWEFNRLDLFSKGLYTLVIGLASAWLGFSLAHFSNIARISAGFLTVLAIVVQGVGTLIFLSSTTFSIESFLGSYLFFVYLGAMLLALFNRRAAVVCSEGYRRLLDHRPGAPPGTYSSPFFWAPFVGLVLFVAVVVVALYTFSR
jgi:hypothetical protein